MLAQRLLTLLTGRRGKFVALVLWLAAISAIGPLAVKLSGALDNDQLGALPAKAEVSRAAARAATAFPEPDALVAVVVYARDGGLTPTDTAKVEADRAAFAPLAIDGRIDPPVPAADGRATLLSFPLAGDSDAQSAAVDTIKHQLESGTPPDLKVALTGSAGADHDLFDAFSGMDGALLLATGLAVALLLILTYRSPVLWLIPLVAVGFASQLASGVVYLLAKHAGLTVDFQSQSILTILVFGVGVDYALLLISRYREALRIHPDRHAAMAVAWKRCVPAIAASAATVTIGLLCLLAADLPATRGLGPVGAAGVVAAFLVMTTLLPALLLLFGRWVFWPFIPRAGQGSVERRRLWARVAGTVGARPRAIWVGTALALVVLTLGVGRLSIGLPGDETYTKEVGSVTGQHLIAAHYPAGTSEPARILAAAGSADAVAAAARGVAGVAQVGAAQTSADGAWVRIDAVLADAPESPAAERALRDLRSAVHAVPGAQALVDGDTATVVDTDDTTSRDNWVVIPLILGVVLLVLVLLLRAIVAPLLLLASVVFSYAAALGAAGLVLHAWGHPRLWSAIPLQTFLFLVALGVDYSIFLMTRAREEAAAVGHRAGVPRALAVTGGVVTSAGIVLATTFAALCVLPLVPSVQMAVIVALGVLLDTFLVRSLLVPALALDLGRRTWWPGRLSRAATVPAAPLPAQVPDPV
jgi:putative drug exporter of the RND superfamily